MGLGPSARLMMERGARPGTFNQQGGFEKWER
jgi:hypothetical protein